MADTRDEKATADTTFNNTPSPEPSVDREVVLPPGWKYRSLSLGPVKFPWYASPKAQLLLVAFVCFLCPGMFNAVNGLGGGGQVDHHAGDASNTALYATFSVVGFFAGTIVNWIGIKWALSFGGLGYCIYIAAYLCYNHTANFGFIVFSGFFLGCCAGILWAAQGAIMMSYPTEEEKGRYISWFWVIFNLGAVIGSLAGSSRAGTQPNTAWHATLGTDPREQSKYDVTGAILASVPLGENIHVTTNSTVSDGTYIGFIVLSFCGALLAWTLCDGDNVIRSDGSRVILMKHPTWKTEIFGLWETLLSDPYIIFLFPMFFSSNWFYTYQFNAVNGAYFSTRTRALNSLLYWLAQIVGAIVFGFALDFRSISRSLRAKINWIVLFVLTMVIWGGGYAFERQYTRADTEADDWTTKDWADSGYVGPMFLYIFYGFYDAAWQTSVYWFMGAMTNNGRKLANFAGFYKGIQSAGAAIIWRMDGLGISYTSEFASTWALLAGSLVIAAPVMWIKIKDHVSVEEDIRLSDQTVGEVTGAEKPVGMNEKV
ncbi:MFS general substrate transporter [Polychaeton citri CBS 116435]|uniref:MFS general substrate transporter n=1 Tax=Polychaeton citri CBS 116435 TaxID=1314669 RepID=A0A9P4Q1G5_9PEZI|nr:MFS general substrate transporter [Polychaeton citri CBS 116435]